MVMKLAARSKAGFGIHFRRLKLMSRDNKPAHNFKNMANASINNAYNITENLDLDELLQEFDGTDHFIEEELLSLNKNVSFFIFFV